MDKIKQALNSSKLFWIASGSIAVIMLVCWFIGAGEVAGQAAAGVKEVEANFKTVRGIPHAVNDHPCPPWLDKRDEDIEKQKDAIQSAWQGFYNSQKDNVYVWPADDLTDTFLSAIDNSSMNALARPLKDDPKATGEDKPKALDSTLRVLYRDEVHKWFPRLANRVVYGLNKGEAATAGALRLVDWSAKGTAGEKENQMVSGINTNHFKKWAGRTPTTREVLIAQEDFWVYTALCEIIIDANHQAKATGPHDTVVRTILTMDIAQDAVEKNPRGQGADRFKIPKPEDKGDKKAGDRDDNRKPAVTYDEKLMHKRYVDDKGVGVRFDTKPDKEPFREYRLLPIRMTLVVDKAKLQYLLSAFSDSQLPVEVQQLRLNPKEGGGAGVRRGQDDKGGAKGRYAKVIIQAVAYLLKDVDHDYLKMKRPEKPVVADNDDAAAKPAGE